MTKQKCNDYLLAGDIGGTKTALALYDKINGPFSPLAEKTVQNDTVSGLDEIIQQFLQENAVRPRVACLGVAGPVINNRVWLTNRDWTIDGQQLQQSFGLADVLLINDLVATAMGAVNLPKNALHTLNEGQKDPQGCIAVMAPGTGLGESFLVRSREDLLPCPSEGGHSLFAPANARQRELLLFMQQEYGQLTVEDVCSGLGLPRLYAFLKTEMEEPPGFSEKMQEADDQAKIIVEAAMDDVGTGRENGLPVETLRLFTEILAAEAANLVLKVLATGGLYIGGGIPPRILPFLTAPEFVKAFAGGIYGELLSRVPVHVILEPKTALIGTAAYGISLCGRKDTNR